ncbi:MAG: hypothetical protein KAI25_01740, partial [Hyphomicrobiaceae bacterium]|nr:hypothetical protein [Hyphomicrobiaceae bacterium]
MTASEASEIDWIEANQQYLSAALTVVRSELKSHAQRSENTQEADDQINAARQAMQEAKSIISSPFPLDMLCTTFSLSLFERDVLLLCAGMELDCTFPQACADAQGDPSRAYPTFGLALAAMPDAHWSA